MHYNEWFRDRNAHEMKELLNESSTSWFVFVSESAFRQELFEGGTLNYLSREAIKRKH